MQPFMHRFYLCLLHTICNTAAMRAGDKRQSSVTMVQTVENVYFHDYMIMIMQVVVLVVAAVVMKKQ